MNLSKQTAKHFGEVNFGGNWTCVNLKEVLTDITWQQATTQLYSFNTIATLVFHINYYVDAVLKVLQGEPLDSNDVFSFKTPPINSAKEWEDLRNKTFSDAEKFVGLLQQLPKSKMYENLAEEKYGSYYRNIHGIIEHTHYHLGQIVVLKKLLAHIKQ